MRFSRTVALVAIIGCISLAVSNLRAGDDAKKAAEKAAGHATDKAMTGAEPNMDEMMKKFVEMNQPSEHHKTLLSLVGNWEVATEMRMTPDAPWTKSNGSCTSSAGLGGRWLMSNFKGNMPMPGPDGKTVDVPFEGHGMMGYDNMTQKHISIWADSMSTGVMKTEGACDASGKVITFKDEIDNPMMPGTKCKIRYIITIESPDKYTMQWHEDQGQGEFHSMTITYTRAK